MTGAPMGGSITEEIMVDDEGVATLIIKGVTNEAEGDFSCHAKNEHGSDERHTRLNVRDATRLTRFPEDLTVTAGAEVRLPCDADSDAFLNVQYKWLIEGNEINQVSLGFFSSLLLSFSVSDVL